MEVLKSVWGYRHMLQLSEKDAASVGVPIVVRAMPRVADDVGLFALNGKLETTALTQLFKKHYDSIGELFNDLTELSREHQARCAYLKDSVPCRFVSTPQIPVALMVGGVFLPITLNTLRMESPARAAHIVKMLILPAIHKFHERLGRMSVGYGMCVFYGSRDFSKVDELSKPEMIAVFISNKAASAYANGEMTDEQLLLGCEAYGADRDSIGGVRRITIKL
jgi:hypothetical protein